MVKKCIIEYDELGNPIEIVELKEFNDIKSFKDFEELCKKNRKAYEDRMAEQKAKLKKEKEQAIAEIEYMKKGIVAAMEGITYLLGYSTHEADEVLAMFKELLPKGEIKDEEEH